MPDQTPVIDWSTLLALRAFQPAGEPDIVRELADVFLAESTRLNEEAHLALAAGDRELLRRAVHRVYGSAAAIGAERLRDSAVALERQLRAEPHVDPALLLQRLDRALDEVRGELQRIPPAR